MQFTQALKNLFFLEGQGWEPNMDGGTYSGIKQSTYDSYRLMCSLPTQSVQFISGLEIQDIYYRNYWLPLKCDALPDGIDFAVFQAGVNQGVGTAAKMLQTVVDVTADGHIGPVTLNAVNSYVATYGSQSLADAYLQAQKDRYAVVIEQNPEKSIYWQGWLNRVDSTYAMIAGTLTTIGQAVASVATAAASAVEDNPGATSAALLAGGMVFFSC